MITKYCNICFSFNFTDLPIISIDLKPPSPKVIHTEDETYEEHKQINVAPKQAKNIQLQRKKKKSARKSSIDASIQVSGQIVHRLIGIIISVEIVLTDCINCP